DVASRELPEQTPINKLVSIKLPCWASVEEGIPTHVAGYAIGGHRPYPLALAMRRVATHPRLYLRDLPGKALFDPLLGIGESARAFMLKANRGDLTRALGRRPALLGFLYGTSRLLAVKIFVRGQRIEQVPGVPVQRTGDQNRVDVLNIEETTMIVCPNFSTLSCVVPVDQFRPRPGKAFIGAESLSWCGASQPRRNKITF